MVDIWKQFVHFGRLAAFCPLCGRTRAGDATVCSDCHADLPWNRHACKRCGIPLADAGVDGVLCGRCLRAAPAFDAACCAFRYQFPVNRLLVKLKFHADLGAARALGALLAEYVERRTAQRPGAIVPVPLHPQRLRRRGFNQAAEIARELGRRLDVPVASGVCVRRRATAEQSSLSATARRRNVRDAFEVTGPLPARHLAVVDDVVTTTATAGEVARALRAAGARTVLLWSPARA